MVGPSFRKDYHKVSHKQELIVRCDATADAEWRKEAIDIKMFFSLAYRRLR
jgi:hypothetical protein